MYFCCACSFSRSARYYLLASKELKSTKHKTLYTEKMSMVENQSKFDTYFYSELRVLTLLFCFYFLLHA